MSQYTLSYIHSAKCKKEAKLDALMSKELQKAAKAKQKQILCKVTTEKVLFKNRKEVIIRRNIAKTRENKEKNTIALATKTEKKNQMLIYTLNFADKDNFNRFSEEISNKSKDHIDEKHSPTAPSGTQTPASTKRPQSAASRHEELHQYDNINSSQRKSNGIFRSESRVSTSPSTESTLKTMHSSRRSHTPSRVVEMRPKPRSATSTSSSSSSSTSKVLLTPTPRQQNKLLRTSDRTKSLPSVSTYITTDVLNSPKRAGGPQRDSMKMPISEVYPTRDGPQKHRSRAEVSYLNYVPGKGMVNSGKENIYHYSSRIRNASLSSPSVSSSSRSSSRSSNSSSSTSSTDLYENGIVYRLVPVNVSKASGIKRSNSRRRSGMRRVSVTSSSSSTTRNEQKPKINVWQYRDLSVSSTSSTSTDMSRDALQRSRKQK